MVALTHATNVSGGASAYLAGVTDLQVVMTAGGPVLHALSRAHAGIATLGLTPQGLLGLSGQTAFPAAVTSDAMLASVTLGQTAYLLSSAQSGNTLAGFTLQASGAVGPAVSLPGGGGIADEAPVIAAAVVGGKTFLVSGGLDSAGLMVHELGPDLALTPVATAPDTGATYAADIADIVVVQRGGTTFVLVASPGEDGVGSYRLDTSGGLTPVQGLGGPAAPPLATPTDIAVIDLAGRSYAVIAAAGNGTLTVVEVLDDGRMIATDQVMDTLGTRFAAVGVVEAIVVDGRAFVVAGGADDGITVFELLPGGRLVHTTTFADTAGTTLQNVSALALAVVGGEVHVFATSETEPGVTQFVLDPGPTGLRTIGGDGADTLTGTAGDDILIGGGGNDMLSGGAGRDILVDGAGSDSLRGGAGADLFVLTPDGEVDTILDFEPGIDRLDLSAFFMLYSAAQLQIVATATGAEIRFGDEVIVVQSASGDPIAPATFTTATVIDMPRVHSPTIWLPRFFAGTPDHDVLEGGPLGDGISGGAGDDTIFGGGGDDLLRGEDGADRINAGEGNDTLHGGTGGDFLIGAGGADILWGEDGNDRLYGGTGDDTLDGGRGSDEVFGEEGHDLLYGDDGFDYLAGGAGNDTLWGGNGNDRLLGGNDNDQLWGGPGNDTLWGGPSGNDILRGEDGDDWLYGESGADWLHGGAGHDRLFGGNGLDTLIGADGNDTLDGGLHDDQLFGGSGDDLLIGGEGADRLAGEAGADTLDGGAGDDWLAGGDGADTFVFLPGGGRDTIADFDPAGGDVIDLRAIDAVADWNDLAAHHLAQTAGGALITLSATDSILLAGVGAAALDPGDFLF